jgi:hypothetical protein
MKYDYHIYIDDGGDFFASVRDENCKTVLEIRDEWLLESGIMKHKNDLEGLKKYLISLDILCVGDDMKTA